MDAKADRATNDLNEKLAMRFPVAMGESQKTLGQPRLESKDPDKAAWFMKEQKKRPPTGRFSSTDFAQGLPEAANGLLHRLGCFSGVSRNASRGVHVPAEQRGGLLAVLDAVHITDLH